MGKKPREMPTYKKYKHLIDQHKKIYEASGATEKYESRYWVDNDTSWRELDSHTKRTILRSLEVKIVRKEL